jgi:hexosaminidase
MVGSPTIAMSFSTPFSFCCSNEGKYQKNAADSTDFTDSSPRNPWHFDVLSFIIECVILRITGYFIIFALGIAILLSQSIGAPQPNLHVMPMPEHVVPGEGRLPFLGSFTVRISGPDDPILTRGVNRFMQRLQRRIGTPVRMEPTAAPDQADMLIQCSGPAEPVQSLQADESYQLEVNARGVRLAAPSPVGILRGIETFMQLVDQYAVSFFVPYIKIEDRPRFLWRGLHIDVSRHFEPPEVIRRNLDAMAAVKLNVFHWHLSDDQGFRIESRRFPKLQRNGSDGKYYTQAEVREIVDYARDRGIRVIPEFDVPGHTTAWLAAYPELASAPGPYRIEHSWGIFDPCMDPTRNAVYSFLDSFVAEMAGLFPDEYFHIGGDEVNGKQWNASARIRAFKARNRLKDNRDLQAYFNRRLQKILARHGKKMIGWDEILHPGLPVTAIVQSWQGRATLADGARRGYAGILSYGYYLDAMHPASFHYEVDPQGKEAASLTPEESARIIGGEACMWAEFVDPDNIDSRIWPRTAAIAERLWSSSDVTDVQDMYRRLEFVDGELERLGLRHRANSIEMTQRMSGGGLSNSLRNLSDILIPTGFGPRHRNKNYTSLTPLNRMVDAVLPESATAREFDGQVQKFLADPSGSAATAQQIRKTMMYWRDNDQQVQPVLEGSLLMQEILPLSSMVAELCSRGLQAMDYIELRQEAPEGWKRETAEMLDRAEKPQADMLPAILASIKRLADAVN